MKKTGEGNEVSPSKNKSRWNERSLQINDIVRSHFHFANHTVHPHKDGSEDERYFSALGCSVANGNQCNSPLPPMCRRIELTQYFHRPHPISTRRRFQYFRSLENSLKEINGTHPVQVLFRNLIGWWVSSFPLLIMCVIEGCIQGISMYFNVGRVFWSPAHGGQHASGFAAGGFV